MSYTATQEEISAAWAAWKSRHGDKLGPGPAFVEAINAALSVRQRREEAALSTDAEPVGMDDEDRTPTPAGFDDALWRKADEVHHAMALVARDQECVKIIYGALSTDAEPFAWISQHKKDPKRLWLAAPNEPEAHDWHAAVPVYASLPALYTEAVKTAPAVAVKALEPFATDADIYDGQDIDDGEKSFNDNITVGDLRRARAAYAALSAQVQDVAVPEAKPENKAEPDRSKFPYVWEGPKPDDAIIHKVINAYMGAQDREYDIDQFRYYKANWQWHYTLNQHMKEAVDACASPASKHGDAE